MKCVVDRCRNESWQGNFIGNMCKPCHSFYTEELEYLYTRAFNKSQAKYNRIEQIKSYLMEAELQVVRDKWEKT